MGSQETFLSGSNARIVINGNVYAIGKTYEVRWGNEKDMDRVTGTDLPVPATKNFYGDGKIVVIWSSEDTAAKEQFRELLIPVLGEIPPITLSWQGTDIQGNLLGYVLSMTALPKECKTSVDGPGVMKSEMSFDLIARPEKIIPLPVWPQLSYDERHSGDTINPGAQTGNLDWTFTGA